MALLKYISLLFAVAPLVQGDHEQGMYPKADGRVEDLTLETFEAKVMHADSPDSIQFVLYYAHWCGHCQAFKGTYQGLADQFSEVRGTTFLALDCAEFRDMCTKADIKGYPSLKAYKAGSTFGEEWHSQEQKAHEYVGAILQGAEGTVLPEVLADSELYAATTTTESPAMEGYRNVEEPVKAKVKTNFFENEISSADDRLFDGALAFGHSMVTAVFVGRAEELGAHKLEALRSVVLPMVAGAHPSAVFRREVLELLNDLEGMGGVSRSQWMSLMRGKSFLGGRISYEMMDSPDAYWRHCKQLSCGLWQLFHSLTFGIDRDYISGANLGFLSGGRQKAVDGSRVMEGIRAFVADFFLCDECREHFLDGFDSCIFDRCVGLPERRHVAMWLWRFHNGVSHRTSVEQELAVADTQWPSQKGCPECRMIGSTGFHDKLVYRWLQAAYVDSAVEEIAAPGLVSVPGILVVGLVGVAGMWLIFRLLRSNGPRLRAYSSPKGTYQE